MRAQPGAFLMRLIRHFDRLFLGQRRIGGYQRGFMPA